MNTWRLAVRSAALAAGLLLATAGPAAQARAPGEVAGEAGQEARDILVMLRLPPEHLRPGSGYGQSYGDRLAGRARERLAREIAATHGLEVVGEGWPMPLLGVDCYVMRIPADRTADAVVAALAQDERVAWSAPLQTYRTPAA